MFCPRCGKEIQNNQRFCTNCGYDCSKDTNENEGKDEFSYKHKSYYKKPIKKDFDVSKFTFNTGIELMFKGFLIMALLLAGLLGVNFIKRYISSDLFGLDRAKYESYMQDPTSIPELTQPENLDGLIKNLKDTQNFLALYLKYSDDSSEVKADVFDNYRKQLLKIEGFSNDNLLKDDFKYSLPQTAKEFKKCERHYNGELKSVGLKIVADTTYSKYHLCEDNRFTDKKFGKLVEPTMSKYLKLRAKHYKEFLSTGYLAVKPKEMNSRIADYENFLNANPEFKNIKEVQDWLYCYTIGYIFASDREDMNAIRHSKFKKLDKSFIRKYKNSKLIPIFSKMVSSANGISTNQFDNLYPYEYEKMLNSIRPSDGNLEDIFATQRKELMKKLSNVGYRYVYSTESDSWETFNDISKIGKDCLLLADNGHGGFDIYDNKFKKTNQTLIFDQNAKVMIKRGSLLVYTPVSLQVSRVEYFYGSFNTKVLSSRAIREYFPDVLIINVDNIGNEPVQITKDKAVQSYMLISHAGSNFDGYQLNADGPMTRGELSNIFTINSPTTVNVEWLPANTAGQCYSMSFVSNIPQSEEPQQNTSQPEATQTNGTTNTTKTIITKPLVKAPVKATVKAPVQEEEDNEHF